MKERLDARQREAAARFLDREESERRHLVVSVSGAHAYGFPSPDSDVDLKAVHVDATDKLLGLFPPLSAVERLEVVNGVELDYTSNELRPVLVGVLQGNGNYVERLLAPTAWSAAPELETLKPLVRRVMSRRLHRHYRGFAASQWKAFQQDGASAKRALYVLRTALTGIHVLRTGKMVVDVTELLDEYGFSAAHELVTRKKDGERIALDEAETRRWGAHLESAMTMLEDAREGSCLPEEPPGYQELDAWLIEVRKT